MRAPNDITGAVVDAAIEIHRTLGPGLLESAYEEILVVELQARGLTVERQLMVPFEWKGHPIHYGFRIDLLVEGRVVVELKSTEKHSPIHVRQLLTYLRIMKLRYGLLVNFGAARMIDGIQRVSNGFSVDESPPN
ncbi:MAG: GxxExxY protein [Gemmatimonadaceae bacterium]|nr:GxxExxY protein [Gemmatimonadaceae bacterium]